MWVSNVILNITTTDSAVQSALQDEGILIVPESSQLKGRTAQKYKCMYACKYVPISILYS